MARFTFTQDDILRGKLITPGWQTLEVISVEDVTAASSGAAGNNVHFRVVGGAFDGVPLERGFYESGVGFAKPFFEALGAKVEAGVSFDITEKSVVGKRVEGYIVNGTTNRGNVRNEIKDFRAVRSAAKTA